MTRALLNWAGVHYAFFGRLGLAVGLVVSAVLAVLAVFIPAAWPWVWVPAAVGTGIGLVVAAVIK